MGRTTISVLRRLVWFSFAIVVVAVGTIAVHNNAPDKYLYKNGDWDGAPYSPPYDHDRWNVLLDPHSHSTASDGRLTPEQNIRWHLSMGFNAMVLTDHNILKNSDIIREIARSKYKDRIKALLGVEWTTSRIHMSFIYPPNAPNGYKKIVPPTDTPTDEDIQSAITEVHKLGGVVVVCHPLKSRRDLPDYPTFQELKAWGIDFIESVNRSEFDEEAYNFCLANGIGMITATDMHIPTAVHGWTLMKVDDFSEEAIFNELKLKRTDIVYLEKGSGYSFRHDKNPVYTFSKPLLQIASIFKEYDRGDVSLDWLGLGVLIFYIYGSFGIFIGIQKIFVRMRR